MKRFTLLLYIVLFGFVVVTYSDFQYDSFFNLKILFDIIYSVQAILILYYLVFISLLIISFLLLNRLKRINNDLNLSLMELFLFVFGVYFTVGGFLNAVTAYYEFPKIPMAIDIGLYNNILCLIIIVSFYFLFNFLFSLRKAQDLKKITLIDLEKLRKSAIILFLLSIVGILLYWKYYGSIPVFSGFGISNINMDITEKIPIWVTYLSDLFPIYALYIGIYYISKKRKDLLVTALLLLLLILLILTGVRFPLIVSFVLSFTLLYPFIRENKKYIIQIALILMIIYSMLGVWRNRDTSKIAIPGVFMVVGQMGVEFSEYSRLLAVLNTPTYHPSNRSGNEIIYDNMIIPSLPSTVWSIVGVNRKDFKELTYLTFGKLIYNSNFTGIRPGVFGEVYYGFGVPGLIGWSICLAFLINYFDYKRKYYQSFSQDSFYYIITNLWGVILTLTVFNQINNTVHFFTTSFIMFYVIYSFSKSEVITNE